MDLSREEIVRVATFQETLRSDESILFQQVLRMFPGAYKVNVTVRDVGSTSESRATQPITRRPAFGKGSFSAPILAYQATGRGSLTDPLSLVLNPRGAVGYGSDTLLAYIEGYDFAGPTTVPFQVLRRAGALDLQRLAAFPRRPPGREPGGPSLTRQRVPRRAQAGRRGRRGSERSMSALVSFTQAWVVTNFDEMLDILRYFGHDQKISAMRKAPESERARLWREFYAETDPNPVTPENEALNQYFSRVNAANQRFTDEGIPGWRTDRGEVYINLGPPDESIESTPGSREPHHPMDLSGSASRALLPGRDRIRPLAPHAELAGRVRAYGGEAAGDRR